MHQRPIPLFLLFKMRVSSSTASLNKDQKVFEASDRLKGVDSEQL